MSDASKDEKRLPRDVDDRTLIRDEMLHVASVPERALLRVLATAHERHLDASELVLHLAGEFSGRYAQRLTQLAASLSHGQPIVKALQRTPYVLDASTVMALKLAEEDGALPQMYRNLLATDTSQAQESRMHESNPMSEIIRSTIGICFALLVLSFLMIFILPTFQKMFEEFGMELPAMVQLLFALSPYVPLVLLGVLAAEAAFFFWNYSTISESFFNRFTSLAWRKQAVPPPIKFLSLLAIATQSGRSTEAGIKTLSRSYPTAKLRLRLERAASRIECGEESFAALASERLITPRESAALSATSLDSTRAWLLRWFAARRWDRSQIWAPLFARALSTFTTLFLGFIVAWTALGVLMSLFALISGLT